jgi:cytochrome b pre-mRNA-processing protein 3
MIFQLFRRSPQTRIIAALYGTIVAQARAPVFYQTYGVPDTVNGRFEMLVLHVVILLNRLRAEPGPVGALGQGIFDYFCSDMDGNLREMGVGDLAVPANMRRIGEAFYGRQAAYEATLAGSDPSALAQVLGRTIFEVDQVTNTGAHRLAAYVLEAVRHLATQDIASHDGNRLGSAELAFPDPDKIPSMLCC